MTDAQHRLDRFVTGVPGLDFILDGGFLVGGVYIVHGPPGAGKTILANQICFHRARGGDRAVYVTLLAETHARLVSLMRQMSFFDPALVPSHVQYLSGFRTLEDQGLHGLLQVLRHAMIETKAAVLVIDGLVSAEEVAMTWGLQGGTLGQAQDVAGANSFRKFIHELETVAGMTGCTVLLLGSTERARAFHPAYTMVDGIVELTDDLHKNLRPLRHINVRKVRGVKQKVGRHIYEITNDGVMVLPRVESTVPPSQENLEEGVLRGAPIAFGVPGLDEMMRGGLPHNSMTMLLGSTGTGKTLLGMQFLAEGARRGEPGVLFGFHERPAALLRKGERLGLELDRAVQDGLLEIVWQPVSEAIVDVLAHRMFAAIERIGARRLFIDGMQGYHHALDDYPERISGVLSALSDELQRRQITTVYTVETQDIFGPSIVVPQPGISEVTQNMILLRHVEVAGRLHMLLTIVKVRDTDHDRSVRELCITDEGLVVKPFTATGGQTMTPSSTFPLHPHEQSHGGSRRP
jgi:circadian clock protein KaiC